MSMQTLCEALWQAVLYELTKDAVGKRSFSFIGSRVTVWAS